MYLKLPNTEYLIGSSVGKTFLSKFLVNILAGEVLNLPTSDSNTGAQPC